MVRTWVKRWGGGLVAWWVERCSFCYCLFAGSEVGVVGAAVGIGENASWSKLCRRSEDQPLFLPTAAESRPQLLAVGGMLSCMSDMLGQLVCRLFLEFQEFKKGLRV